LEAAVRKTVCAELGIHEGCGSGRHVGLDLPAAALGDGIEAGYHDRPKAAVVGEWIYAIMVCKRCRSDHYIVMVGIDNREYGFGK
jgi:hypothetical protein